MSEPWLNYASTGAEPAGGSGKPWEKYAVPAKPAPPPEPAKPPEKPPLLSEAGAAFVDVPREIGHEFMEEGRAAAADVKKTKAPKWWQLGPTGPELGALGHAMGQAAAPVTGALTSVLGRPIETMTGGKVKREAVGNVAAMAIPFAQEVAAARDASALGKALGVSEKTAREVITRVGAAKKAAAAGDKAAMAENVKAMDRLGIKPSTALTRPGKDMRQTAQTLGQNLVVGAPVRAAVRRTVKGVEAATDRTARELGEPKSVTDAGNLVKKGVERFAEGSDGSAKGARAGMAPETAEAMESQAKLLKSNTIGFGKKADILYEKANRLVGGGGQMIPMDDTQAALNDIRHRINDPQFVDFNAHPKVLELAQALEEQKGKMSFDGARRLRSLIRSTLRADPALKASIDSAEIEKLYQAMSRDLSTGAEKLGGAEARKSFEQTDRYYRAGRERIERSLDQVFDADTPNKVFYDLLTDAQEGKRGDLQRLMQLRRSLKPDEWRDVSASILDSMGRSLPGQRTQETNSSFRTFLTNFNKLEGGDAHLQSDASMADSGLKVLFDGAGHGETYQHIRDIARAVSQLRESDKLVNHSNSGSLAANTATAMGLLGSGQASVMFHSTAPAIGAFLGVLGGNAASLVLESPHIARYLAGVAKDGESLGAAAGLADLEAKAAKDEALLPLLAAVKQAVGPDHQAGPAAAHPVEADASADPPPPNVTHPL